MARVRRSPRHPEHRRARHPDTGCCGTCAAMAARGTASSVAGRVGDTLARETPVSGGSRLSPTEIAMRSTECGQRVSGRRHRGPAEDRCGVRLDGGFLRVDTARHGGLRTHTDISAKSTCDQPSTIRARDWALTSGPRPGPRTRMVGEPRSDVAPPDTSAFSASDHRLRRSLIANYMRRNGTPTTSWRFRTQQWCRGTTCQAAGVRARRAAPPPPHTHAIKTRAA